jgi:pilus assembly protein CpaB
MLIVVLIVAIVLGGIATFSIWSFLRSNQQEMERIRATLADVVVAAENIPLGATIEQRHLKTIKWPKADVPPGTFQDTAPLIGRNVVAEVIKGEPLFETRLANADNKSGLMAYIIPEGHRAMAVAVNDVAGVAGFVLPNSTVDVIVTTTPPKGERISKIVLQNLRVLAVGQKMEQKDGKAIQVPSVTVSITPEEAEKLALASNVGTLQLLLRGAKDNAPESTRGASIPNLLSGSTQPVARVARRTRTVAVQEKAAPVRENEEVNITIIKSDKGGTTRSQERLIEDGGFWKRSEVSK